MTTDEQGRIEPPEAADELDTLVGFLEFHRATFALKTGRLGDADLHASPTTSSMTLGGMLKHPAAGGVRVWFADQAPSRRTRCSSPGSSVCSTTRAVQFGPGDDALRPAHA